MSFLEPEEEKKSALWDWVLGIGLLVLVGGFTVYYQTQKRSTRERFHLADSLFQAGDFAGAARAYENLKDASYITASDDSVIYERMDSVEDLTEREKEAVARLRMRFAAGDVEGARADLDTLIFRGLLPARDQQWVDSVMASMPGKP
jgi:hypothetical protein